MYRRAIFFLAGVVLLAFVLYMVDFYEVVRLMLTISPIYFLLLLIIQSLIIFLSALKWKIVLREMRVSVISLIPVSMVGYLVNNITPIGLAGGEPARAYILYKKEKIPIEKSFASVIVDLFLEILPIFLLAIISIAFILLHGIQTEIAIVLGFLTLILLGLFITAVSLALKKKLSKKLIRLFLRIVAYLPVLNKRLENTKSKLDDVYDKFNVAMKDNMTDKYVLLYGTLISIIKWILVIGRVYVVFLALGINISFIQVTIAETAVVILSGIPLLPGALGIWEGASIVLFTKIAGILAAKAAAVTLVDRILFYLLPSLIGAIFAVKFGINILKSEEMQTEMKIKTEILQGKGED